MPFAPPVVMMDPTTYCMSIDVSREDMDIFVFGATLRPLEPLATLPEALISVLLWKVLGRLAVLRGSLAVLGLSTEGMGRWIFPLPAHSPCHVHAKLSGAQSFDDETHMARLEARLEMES